MELIYRKGDLSNNLDLKEYLFNTDGPHCVYCYSKFDSSEELTIDHVIPRKFEGSNRLHNLVLCCQTCNTIKKDKGGEDHLDLFNFLWQTRRNRRVYKNIKFETLPARVLNRLPRVIRAGYIINQIG